ncbi:phosphotransferase family protein [Minwuia sp.]|uniref:phosphotransferase family protein n=1 Tax=Minwuia sp. TaxID=2493630 RepID=UPI003A8E29F8
MTELETALAAALSRRNGERLTVTGLTRLSAGASREAYAFEATDSSGAVQKLILKRDPPGSPQDPQSDDNRFGADRATEAAILDTAHRAGVPAPEMIFLAEPEDGVGTGFVMQALEGETLPQKILRDENLDTARARLPVQLGEALARLHAIPPDGIPGLRTFTLDDHLKAFRRVLDDYGQPQPGFEYGLQWLHRRRPPTEPLVFAHGDYRMGNIMVDESGLAGILDWEVGHRGDRHIDLSWPSVRAWRFGRDETPLAGVGQRADFLAAYEAAGGKPVDPTVVHYWEVLGTLRWGIMCMTIGQQFTSGRERSVEKAVIGRRVAETELDFLMMIDPV